MKLFIDSADVEEIRLADESAIIDGVTTNPSLIKKAAEKNGIQDMYSYIHKILDTMGTRPVSLEVAGGDQEQMYAQAKKLYDTFSHHNNHVVIKIPINPVMSDGDPLAGLKVVKRLSQEGISTNVTLIFTPEQALLAAKAGATFVSPFLGRIDDDLRKKHNIAFEKTDYYPQEGKQGIDDNGIVSGIDLVAKCVLLLQKYETQVLAASIRSARQVREIALAGADVATIPKSVFIEMTTHELTKKGMESFTNDLVEEYTQFLR